LRVFGNYYPDIFLSFWEQLDAFVLEGGLISCREVHKEIERQSPSEHLNNWVNEHLYLFIEPSGEEMRFVSNIFKVEHFRQMIGQKQQLTGLPVADPFLIARGAILSGCIVTEEVLKPHAAKIPNVCKHFGIPCINVQGFLNELNWQF